MVFLTTACEEPFGVVDWTDDPVHVTLYSASREAYVGRPSVFDLASLPPRALPVEGEVGAFAWDFVLIDYQGGLALAPASTVDGIESRAGIATMSGSAFDKVVRAPGDSAAYSRQPVKLQTGVVYVLRSRPTTCTITTGVIYAKIEPVQLDVANGIFEFKYVDNPNCGDRSLVPED